MEEWECLFNNALSSKGLYVSATPEKGRCLLASRSFIRGDIILEQDPFVAVLNNETESKRCDGCYKLEMNVKRCGACKHIWYCSSTCQRKEWKLHQDECRAMVKLMKEKRRILTPSLQLMLRFLLKRKLEIEKMLPSDALNNHKIIDSLLTHFSQTKEDQLILYAQMANLVKLAVDPMQVDIKDLTMNFCRFACNAHTICDDELRPIGVGLYPVLSIINHSCQPNAIMLFEGKHAVVRTIEPIDEDTEVTVNYIELGAVTATRQADLKEQYFFDCDCSRCSGSLESDIEDLECMNKNCRGSLAVDHGDKLNLICGSCGFTYTKNESMRVVKEAEKAFNESDKLLSCGNISDAMHSLKYTEQLQDNVLHPYSIHRLKTYDSLLKVSMSLEDWNSALRYCRLSLPIYQRSYPPFHPLIGLQFYTCGKLEWYLKNTREAVKAMTRAMEILAVTHGRYSELVKKLENSLQEACLEDAYLHNCVTGNRGHLLPDT